MFTASLYQNVICWETKENEGFGCSETDIAMATAAGSSEFEGQILQCAKYTWKLGRCVGRGTCSVVVEAVGSFNSNARHRRPRDIKGAVKIFKQGQQFEVAGANEVEILEYLNRLQGETECKHHIGEVAYVR